MLISAIRYKNSSIFLIFQRCHSHLFSKYIDKIVDGRKAGLKCHFADCLIRIF